MSNIHQSASISYAIDVLERDSSGGLRVVSSLPPKRNLILDAGLDTLAVRSWSEAFQYGVIGTGTTPTKRDSGSVTFTRSGNTVTASASFFESGDVGKLLKFDSGEEMRITAFTNATTVTVNTSGTLAASEGTIWFVDQTALATEYKRLTTYSNNTGDNQTTLDGLNTLVHKRTWLASAESNASTTIREVGWSWANSSGANLFGRDLLPGLGVTLTAGQILRIACTLRLTITPVASGGVPFTNIFTGGFGGDGFAGVESFHGLSRVQSGGGVDQGSGYQENHTSKTFSSYTITTPIGVPPNPSSTVSRTVLASITVSASTYLSGSFRRQWSGSFSVNQSNSSSIRGIGASNPGLPSEVNYRILFDAATTKTSDYILALTYEQSWGRELVN